MRAPRESAARKSEPTIGKAHKSENGGLRTEDRALEKRNLERFAFEPRTRNGRLSPARSQAGQGEEPDSRCTKIGRGPSGESSLRLNNHDSVTRNVMVIATLPSRGNSLERPKNSKLQHPTSREIPNHKLQTASKLE